VLFSEQGEGEIRIKKKRNCCPNRQAFFVFMCGKTFPSYSVIRRLKPSNACYCAQAALIEGVSPSGRGEDVTGEEKNTPKSESAVPSGERTTVAG
jgi:hypothetical protein